MNGGEDRYADEREAAAEAKNAAPIGPDVDPDYEPGTCMNCGYPVTGLYATRSGRCRRCGQ